MLPFLTLPLLLGSVSSAIVSYQPSNLSSGRNFDLNDASLYKDLWVAGGIASCVRTNHGYFAILGMRDLELQDITVKTTVKIIYGAVVISFSFSSTSLKDESVDLALNFTLEGPWQMTVRQRLMPDETIELDGGESYYTFHCRNHPLVSDVDTAWYGRPESGQYLLWRQAKMVARLALSPIGVTLSWQNRTVPRGGTLVLTTLIQVGVRSVPPRLLLDIEQLPGVLNYRDSFAVSGFVANRPNATCAVVVVPDSDAAKLTVVAQSVPSDGYFNGSVVLAELGVSALGRHRFDFYAVDGAGTTSDPETLWAEVDAPVSAARSAPPTPPPAEFPVLAMRADAGGSDVVAGVARDGRAVGWFRNQWTVNARLVPSRVCASTAHAALVLAWEFANRESVDALLSVRLVQQVNLNDANASAICGSLGDRSGYYVTANGVRLNVFCRNHGMVDGATAYWFGKTEDFSDSSFWTQVQADATTTGGDSLAVISWQGCVIPAGKTVVFSVVLTWGQDSRPPVLDMSATTIPSGVRISDVLTLDGTVSDPDDDAVSVYAVVDRNYSNLVHIGDESWFYVVVNVSDLVVDSGPHVIDFYAIDVTGTFSAPSSFSFSVLIPPVFPTTMSAWIDRFPSTLLNIAGGDRSIPITANGIDWRWGPFSGYDQVWNITAVGAAAIVALSFRYIWVNDPAQLPERTFNISFTGILAVENRPDVSCLNLPGLVGFEARGWNRTVTFMCQNHPFVSDATAYWFGHRTVSSDFDQVYEARWEYASQPAFAISWHDLTLRIDEKAAVSFVARWGDGSNPPSLDMSSTQIPAILNPTSSILLSGTTWDIDNDTINIYVGRNRDYTVLIPIALNLTSPSSFTHQLVLDSLPSKSGVNILEVCAIDSTGTFSAPWVFYFVLNESFASDQLIAKSNESDSTIFGLFATSANAASYGIECKAHYETASREGFIPAVVPPSALTFSRTVKPLGGPAAIIAFSVTSTSAAPELVSISLLANVTVNGNPGPVFAGFADHTGFSVLESAVDLKFLVRDGLRLDADSYWYGPTNALQNNIWRNSSSQIAGGSASSISIAWQNRYVSANHPLLVWAVVTSGNLSTPPLIEVTNGIPAQLFPDDNFTLTVRVSGAQSSSVLIYLLLDGDVRHDVFGALWNLTGISENTISHQGRDLGVDPGNHTLVLYAIDSTGAISAPSPQIAFSLNAPRRTRTATRSPIQTASFASTPYATSAATARRSVIPSPSESKSPSEAATHSISRSPSPSVSLYPSLDVAQWTATDSRISVPGFFGNSRVAVCDFWLSVTGGNHVFVSTHVFNQSGAALIVLELTSALSTHQLISLSVTSTDLTLGTDEAATCSGLPSQNGLKVAAAYAEMYLFCENHPLVVDCDSYWFGPSGDVGYNLYTQVDRDAVSSPARIPVGFAFSWQTRIVPANGRSFFSFLVRWGSESTPPGFSLTLTSSPSQVSASDRIGFQGSVTDNDSGNLISIYFIVNQSLTNLFSLVSQLSSGHPFDVNLSVHDLRLSLGRNDLDFHAIDTTGTISRDSAHLSVTVTVTGPPATTGPSRSPPFATTPPPTASLSRPVRRSPSASATPMATSTIRATPRPTATPLRSGTPLPSATPRTSPPASRTPTRSASPPRTVSASRSPQLIILGGGRVALSSNEKEVVVIGGTGTIVAADASGNLFFAQLVISANAKIAAEGLAVSKRITLNGKSSLSAAEGNSIFVFDDVTVIEFHADAQNLPSLNLGLIGGHSTTLPKALTIDLPSGLSVDELGRFSHALITGNVFANCEQWRSKLVLPSASFTSECVFDSGAISLMIKGVPAPTRSSAPTRSPAARSATVAARSTGGLSGGAIAGIVISAVVVVVVVGGVVVWFVRGRTVEAMKDDPFDTSLDP